MLNQNQTRHTRETNTLPSSPPPELTNPTISNLNTGMLDIPHLKIIQLNCFNKRDTVQEALNLEDVDILLLQEPWTNPFTFKILTHQMWHDITPYDHVPQDVQSKYRTCIYVAKKHPLKNVYVLPSKSTFITTVEIKTEDGKLPKLRVMSFYNRPRTNEGLPVLKQWLEHNNDRSIPTIIGMDANLHHQKWNPAARHNTHPQARDLIKMCGTAGYTVMSEQGVPTFYP